MNFQGIQHSAIPTKRKLQNNDETMNLEKKRKLENAGRKNVSHDINANLRQRIGINSLPNNPVKSGRTKNTGLTTKTRSAITKSTNASSKSTGMQGSTRARLLSQRNSISANHSSVPAKGNSKKRPAWDYKGRLEDMEIEMKMWRDQNQENVGKMSILESKKEQLLGDNLMKSNKMNEDEKRIEFLQNRLDEETSLLKNELSSLRHELGSVQKLKLSFEEENLRLLVELKCKLNSVENLTSQVNSLNTSYSSLVEQLQAKSLALLKSETENEDKTKVVAQMSEEIVLLKEKLFKNEGERKKLHNEVQELKGNIRVFCRIRPLLDAEMLGRNEKLPHFSFPDAAEKVLEVEKSCDSNLNETGLSGNRQGNKFVFTFDKVFSPSSTQEAVFEEISQLVQSSLDGYNVCIFAYGQTGSGKTYTMEGPSNKSLKSSCGMIQRAIDQVFTAASKLEDGGWKYEFEANFLEIYNETVRDLLGDNKDTKHELRLATTGSSDVKVTNVSSFKVARPEEVTKLLHQASENRAVAGTKCNERSSRSHSIFQLRMCGVNHNTKEETRSTLNLIDLAGSERLKDSGSQGERLKETQFINKSLSNLGTVIQALSNKDSHVPYRNSKLTYLLQSYLGGSSKMLMFVNISPVEECLQETLCSLRFAVRVNNCNIGTAQRKIK